MFDKSLDFSPDAIKDDAQRVLECIAWDAIEQLSDKERIHGSQLVGRAFVPHATFDPLPSISDKDLLLLYKMLQQHRELVQVLPKRRQRESTYSALGAYTHVYNFTPLLRQPSAPPLAPPHTEDRIREYEETRTKCAVCLGILSDGAPEWVVRLACGEAREAARVAANRQAREEGRPEEPAAPRAEANDIHEFHVGCIAESVRHSTECPICRQNIIFDRLDPPNEHVQVIINWQRPPRQYHQIAEDARLARELEAAESEEERGPFAVLRALDEAEGVHRSNDSYRRELEELSDVEEYKGSGDETSVPSSNPRSRSLVSSEGTFNSRGDPRSPRYSMSPPWPPSPLVPRREPRRNPSIPRYASPPPRYVSAGESSSRSGGGRSDVLRGGAYSPPRRSPLEEEVSFLQEENARLRDAHEDLVHSLRRYRNDIRRYRRQMTELVAREVYDLYGGPPFPTNPIDFVGGAAYVTQLQARAAGNRYAQLLDGLMRTAGRRRPRREDSDSDTSDEEIRRPRRQRQRQHSPPLPSPMRDVPRRHSSSDDESLRSTRTRRASVDSSRRAFEDAGRDWEGLDPPIPHPAVPPEHYDPRRPPPSVPRGTRPHRTRRYRDPRGPRNDDDETQSRR